MTNTNQATHTPDTTHTSQVAFQNGYAQALIDAHKRIQQFALQNGLDTDSDSYQLDLIIQAMSVPSSISGVRNPADASLIAAAPELLGALIAIAEFIPITTASEGGASTYSAHVRAADKVRAAISRATGGQ